MLPRALSFRPLFLIYAKSLLKELQLGGWAIDDLLGFADDHLVISITKGMLRKAIKMVQEWCREANIKLNPDKSGVMEVTPKGVSPSLELGSKFEGIPVVQEYKYLGITLDDKMNGRRHIEKLFGYVDEYGKKHEGKIDFLKRNLSPLIRNISVDYRVTCGKFLLGPSLSHWHY